MAMHRFDQLATFVDEIHKQLKEQDYIDLMTMMKRLRTKIETPRGADYLVEIQTIIPELKYIGDNEYKFFEYSKYQKLVFNEKDICESHYNRKFDEKEFLALRRGSNFHLSESGQLQYDMINKTERQFILHDSECDYFGTDNCDCSCARLQHEWSATKIWKIEKL